ncbi:MAG: hypothetical protein R3F62_19190 [Planctomycetota bacterium]
MGTTLLITPDINADRTVSLLILQETSNVNVTAQACWCPRARASCMSHWQ